MPNDKALSLARELLEVQRTLGWMDLVIGSIDDAVYVTDSESRIVFANQCFADIVGHQRVFLLGQKLTTIFNVTAPAIPIKDYVLSGTKSKQYQSSGETGIFEWQSYLMEQYVFRISKRNLATTEQTVYLAQNITAEYALSKMKNSFIDLASHQLRTPLTAIMTYSHMLNDGLRGELTTAQKELSSTIIRASERMVKLVDDLLTITRVQNTDTLIDRSNISLSELFTKIESEINEPLAAKSITISVDIPESANYLYSNAAAVREIFSNLIVNAIQYTPNGGHIRVASDVADTCLVVSVSDNGIGIPSDYLPNIFKQFSRAANATAVHPEGTGLGLYVIKVLLDKIGGTISCTSKESEGATFIVELPKDKT